MPLRLNASAPEFDVALTRLLAARQQEAAPVGAAVAAILARVREEGDAALMDYTRQFDRCDLSALGLCVTSQEIAAAMNACAPELVEALQIAAKRIRVYSEKQLPQDALYTDEEGVTLGWRWTPLDAVGLYVPGGRAAYPSSVLMNAVPAKVAGVKRLAMAVPAPDGVLSPAVLAAARIAGVDEIYRIGGAQAVAALAYGTQSIPRVDKIVGPGNAYVAEAKRQVFGAVGIDMIAGPSEIAVVADGGSDARIVAIDLLSQAEHDELAQAILITDDAAFADKVAQEAEHWLAQLPRQAIARAAWEAHGAIILVGDLNDAPGVIDRIAPEHLEILTVRPEALAARVRHAGAIFLGAHTPEAIGDYIAGPSHVLPTSGTARFSSGLSVLDFLKRTSLIGCDAQVFRKLQKPGIILAKQEGLDAHALSMSERKE